MSVPFKQNPSFIEYINTEGKAVIEWVVITVETALL